MSESIVVIVTPRTVTFNQNNMIEFIIEVWPTSFQHVKNVHFQALKLGGYSEMKIKHFEKTNFLIKKWVKIKNYILPNTSDFITKLCIIAIFCHFFKEIIFISLGPHRNVLLCNFNFKVNFCKSYSPFVWDIYWIFGEKIIKVTWHQMCRNIHSSTNYERCCYYPLVFKFNYSEYTFGNKVSKKICYLQYSNIMQLKKIDKEKLLVLFELCLEEQNKINVVRTKVEQTVGKSINKRKSLKYNMECNTGMQKSKSDALIDEKTEELSTKKKAETGLDIILKDHGCIGSGFRWTDYAQNYWSRQSFFQLLTVYPLSNQALKTNPIFPSAQEQRRPINQRDAMNNLMRYEVFRLCSFSFTQFPPNVDLWVTQLAQSGFYVFGSGGHVRCFSCGCEYADFLVGSSIDNAHGHNCQRHEHNRNLNEWTHGLNTEDLAPYFTEYGSLTPNLFNDSETSQQVGNGLSQPQPVGSDYGSSASAALSNSTSHTQYFKGGNEVADTGFSEIGDSTETSRPSSAPLIGNVDSNYVYFVSETHSLPTYLNTVSGALVSQESHESNIREVLTSVARQPTSINYAPIQRATDVQTQDGQDSSEEGAVGGSALQSFDLSRASYPQFASSTARRTTFNGWNPDHPQRPEDLVAGGFFYAGYADCVRCFYCGLGLKYWRPNDIPAYQHARFRPHCVYNRMYRGQEYIDRVQQDIQNEQTQANHTDAETMPATTLPTPSTTTPTTAGSTNSSSASIPEHAFLRLPVAQEALRTGWRSEQIIQAISHIVEELSITSHSIQLDILMDVLISLYSANDQPEAPNLSSGDSDSASESNRNIGDRPVDPNIATVRPPISASVTSKLAERMGIEQVDEGDNEHAEASEVSDGSNTNELAQAAVEQEHSYLRQRTMCGICHEHPVSCVFLPCGHVIACQPCADISTTCKLCHKNIVATANIFLA